MKAYNVRGFGAAGLPPLFFSHLKRNWCNLNSNDIIDNDVIDNYVVDGMELGQVSGGMETGNSGIELWSYGPGMGLDTNPMYRSGVEGEGVGEGVGEGGEEVKRKEGAPPVKRPRLSSKPGLQGRVVQVPSHQVQRYTGGRGYQRARSKKALEGVCLLPW